ncbi:hypothetical protein ONZ45_g949 [Pleurotus djamor]|nr:hypothetical protein ONZ45_g949 [Pleurotus djamor]
MFSSNSHRALQIPELLSSICQYLSPKDTLANACVCKTWSNIALDALWRQVDDISILLSLLAPLEQKSSVHSFKFARAIEPADWTRFARYAFRVRSLIYAPESQRLKHLHRDAFHEVARSRISLDILPNLNTLEWDDMNDLTFCVLFMSKNVKRFRVYLADDADSRLPNGVAALFQNITTRMPNLEYLDISSQLAMSEIEPETIQLFQGLPKLKEVEFPLYYLTPPVTKTLSQLKQLEMVGFQYDEERGSGAAADVNVPPAILDQGAFPALYDFSTSMPFRHATKFFTQPFPPQNITLLFIDSADPELPTDFRNLLEAIVKCCPLLDRLALNPCISTSTRPLTDERITYDILRPILSLPKLTALDINYHYPLDLKYEDIEDMARKWPNLDTLMLNCDPAALDHPPSLTLQALLPFAQYCPNIQRLGLYMNATLAVGLSSISDHDSVAMFLSRMLPEGCFLECGGTWKELELELGSPDSEYTAIQKTWTDVSTVLPLLHKVRAEERRRFEGESPKK